MLSSPFLHLSVSLAAPTWTAYVNLQSSSQGIVWNWAETCKKVIDDIIDYINRVGKHIHEMLYGVGWLEVPFWVKNITHLSVSLAAPTWTAYVNSQSSSQGIVSNWAETCKKVIDDITDYINRVGKQIHEILYGVGCTFLFVFNWRHIVFKNTNINKHWYEKVQQIHCKN